LYGDDFYNGHGMEKSSHSRCQAARRRHPRGIYQNDTPQAIAPAETAGAMPILSGVPANASSATPSMSALKQRPRLLGMNREIAA
jgi:hypothetical protein